MSDTVHVTDQSTGVPVLMDQLDTVNGVDQPVAPETQKPEVQRVKLGVGPEGSYDDVSPTKPVWVGDASPPFVRLDPAVAVTITTTVAQVAAARAGRTRLVLQHPGDQSGAWSLAQRIWIGWNEPPVAGHTLYLDPGGVFDEYVSAVDTFSAILDPSAGSNGSQSLIVLALGSDSA